MRAAPVVYDHNPLACRCSNALEARLELQLQLQHSALELQQAVRVLRVRAWATAVEEERRHRGGHEDGHAPLLQRRREVRRQRGLAARRPTRENDLHRWATGAGGR